MESRCVSLLKLGLKPGNVRGAAACLLTRTTEQIQQQKHVESAVPPAQSAHVTAENALTRVSTKNKREKLSQSFGKIPAIVCLVTQSLHCAS